MGMGRTLAWASTLFVLLAFNVGSSLAPARAQPAGQVEMTFLGNMTFRFVSPTGMVIYTNPYFTGNVDAPISVDQVDKADILLVGSAHGDDGGGPDLDKLAAATGATVILSADMGDVSARLREAGIPASQILGMSPGGNTNRMGPNGSSRWGDLSVRVVPALHGGNSQGYVITFENGLKVYFASDTGLMAEMQIIGDLYQPHVAILPIAGRYMMDPEDAAYATGLLLTNNPNLRWVIPAHWRSGGRSAGGGNPDRFAEAVAERGLPVEVAIPVPGQPVMLAP